VFTSDAEKCSVRSNLLPVASLKDFETAVVLQVAGFVGSHDFVTAQVSLARTRLPPARNRTRSRLLVFRAGNNSRDREQLLADSVEHELSSVGYQAE